MELIGGPVAPVSVTTAPKPVQTKSGFRWKSPSHKPKSADRLRSREKLIFSAGISLSGIGHSTITARFVAYICDENAGCAPAPFKTGSSAMQQQRRRFEQTLSLEERLAQEAKRLRKEAALLPPGKVRDETIRRARQAETGAHMSDWLRSPGLRAPT